MRLFGYEITRIKAATGTLSPVDNRGGWWPIIRESYTGAWQRNVTLSVGDAQKNPTVFRCHTIIACDIAKLCFDLVQQTKDGIWEEAESPAFSPVLRRPNHFQNRIQFLDAWMLSKLSRGNAYILKERDARGVVTALYVLDPCRVTPLVATDGSVWYQLQRDDLSELPADMPAVPASEIIHDRWNCLYHPLVGLSPIYACAAAASQGYAIQTNSANFFNNGARPGGILTAPGPISDATATRLKDAWDANYSGDNSGKVAVLGDGLKFEPMVMTAVDAQLVEQLKWTAETICGVFGVPAYKLNIGAAPLNNNVEALEQQYYSQCLQIHIESIELCLEEGLALPDKYGIEADLDGLLRMDTAAMVKSEVEAVGGGIKSPNEARRRLNLKGVKGGATPYLQQQNYSLAALDERDRNGPFDKATPTPANDQTSAPDAAAPMQDGEAVRALVIRGALVEALKELGPIQSAA